MRTKDKLPYGNVYLIPYVYGLNKPTDTWYEYWITINLQLYCRFNKHFSPIQAIWLIWFTDPFDPTDSSDPFYSSIPPEQSGTYDPSYWSGPSNPWDSSDPFDTSDQPDPYHLIYPYSDGPFLIKSGKTYLRCTSDMALNTICFPQSLKQNRVKFFLFRHLVSFYFWSLPQQCLLLKNEKPTGRIFLHDVFGHFHDLSDPTILPAVWQPRDVLKISKVKCEHKLGKYLKSKTNLKFHWVDRTTWFVIMLLAFNRHINLHLYGYI